MGDERQGSGFQGAGTGQEPVALGAGDRGWNPGVGARVQGTGRVWTRAGGRGARVEKSGDRGLTGLRGKKLRGGCRRGQGSGGQGRSSDAGLPVVWGWRFQGAWGVRRLEVGRQGWGSIFP